ncbi:MAG: hypothetical protein RTU92_14640 [Candidatus Thorarchaeota archaeon]
MLYEKVTDVPRIASKDYLTEYDVPISPADDNDWIAMVYTGTGVSIDEHPLNGKIWMKGCGNCESENVKVIYAQWSVSPHSGDAYWDYEMICSDCGKFTSRSFNEND